MFSEETCRCIGQFHCQVFRLRIGFPGTEHDGTDWGPFGDDWNDDGGTVLVSAWSIRDPYPRERGRYLDYPKMANESWER